MARIVIVKFELGYKVDFTCTIRGHHVYKTAWTPVKKDEREEAIDYDKHAVNVFKKDACSLGTYQSNCEASSIIF